VVDRKEKGAEGIRAFVLHGLKKEKGAEGIRAFFYVLFSE
jgi:hypothetical protein